MSKTPSKNASTAKLNGANKSAQKSTTKARKEAAPAATTEEDEADELEQQTIQQKKKKRSVAPTPAAQPSTDNNDSDDGGDITLFHPSTAVHAASAAAEPVPSAVAPSAASRKSAHLNGAHGDEEELTSEEFLNDLVTRETPELLRILESLQSKLKELRKQTVKPMIKEAKEGKLPTQEGMSFLELKSHLLLQYLQHLVFFIMCKVSRGDQSERLMSVTKQLVYLRTVMEKLKPLEKKLKYQIDKLVKLAHHMSKSTAAADKTQEEGDVAEEAQLMTRDEFGDEVPVDMSDVGMPSEGGVDPLSFRPNPSALLASTDSSSGGGLDTSSTGVYRAPRITSTQLDDHERAVYRRNKALKRAQDRAASSDYLQYVRGELSERPEEIALELDERPDQEQMERTDYEERNLLRLTDTRKDKARKKEKARLAKSSLLGLAGEFDDFRDFDRANRDLRDVEMMSTDRMEELQHEAMGRKRKSHGGDHDEFSFDDPAESRHAKKRKGPNGKNSFGSKFNSSKKGKGKGRR